MNYYEQKISELNQTKSDFDKCHIIRQIYDPFLYFGYEAIPFRTKNISLILIKTMEIDKCEDYLWKQELLSSLVCEYYYQKIIPKNIQKMFESLVMAKFDWERNEFDIVFYPCFLDRIKYEIKKNKLSKFSILIIRLLIKSAKLIKQYKFPNENYFFDNPKFDRKIYDKFEQIITRYNAVGKLILDLNLIKDKNYITYDYSDIHNEKYRTSNLYIQLKLKIRLLKKIIKKYS